MYGDASYHQKYLAIEAMKKDFVAEVDKEVNDIVLVLTNDGEYDDVNEAVADMVELIDRTDWLRSEDDAREAVAFHPQSTDAIQHGYDAGIIHPDGIPYGSSKPYFWRRCAYSLLELLIMPRVEAHFYALEQAALEADND